jgi:7-cyano-7-deazaguanine synthase
MKKAVILLSGGLDSATVLAIAKAQGFVPYALSIRYGQRHAIELAAAARQAQTIGVAEHIIADIDLQRFGGSALTSTLAVPKTTTAPSTIGRTIPVTYVPARNTVFLSLALAWAEVLSSQAIFIGVNALDYSGYPDCRPDYIDAYTKLANLATAAGVQNPDYFKIHAPLIKLTKAQIITWGHELGVDYALTSSCYDPNDTGQPCGCCEACWLRARGFAEAGLIDPLVSSDQSIQSLTS